MTAKAPTVVASVALAIPFSAFLWLAHAADQAMDKTGIGDLHAWETLNHQAGIAFWATGAVWLSILGVAASRSGPIRHNLITVCTFALLLGPLTWFIAILLT